MILNLIYIIQFPNLMCLIKQYIIQGVQKTLKRLDGNFQCWGAGTGAGKHI